MAMLPRSRWWAEKFKDISSREFQLLRTIMILSKVNYFMRDGQWKSNTKVYCRNKV